MATIDAAGAQPKGAQVQDREAPRSEASCAQLVDQTRGPPELRNQPGHRRTAHLTARARVVRADTGTCANMSPESRAGFLLPRSPAESGWSPPPSRFFLMQACTAQARKTIRSG